MKVDVYESEDIIVAVEGQTIVIIDSVEGEAPVDVFQDGKWVSYDYENYPPKIEVIVDKAIVIADDYESMGFADMPEEIKRQLPKELQEIIEIEMGG